MSVILEALRRARRASSHANSVPSTPTPSSVPAGLLNASPRARRSSNAAPSKTRWGLLAGVIVGAASIYAGVRFGLSAASGPAVAATEGVQAWGPPPAVASAPVVAEPPPVAPDPVLPAPAAVAPVVAPIEPAPKPVDRPAPPRLAAAPAPPPAVVPPPSVDHFQLALRYHSLGNFEQALAHYVAVLDADEFNVEARNNLGLLYHERGLVEDAVAQFRRALLIDPQYVRARSNLAVVLMNAGRLSEARAELRAALAGEPRNADLLVNMALVDKADGQPELAKETLLRAIAQQPSHAAAHYNLALLYEQSGERGQAHDHFAVFLKTAGPEHGALLTDVRRRMDALKGGS